MKWKLKDKNGKFRSRRAFNQDCDNDSEEPWEVRRRQKSGLKVKNIYKVNLK